MSLNYFARKPFIWNILSLQLNYKLNDNYLTFNKESFSRVWGGSINIQQLSIEVSVTPS